MKFFRELTARARPRRALWAALGLVALTALGAPSVGRAQATPGDTALRESERIQREQEQRRQDQLRRDQQSARPPTQLVAPAAPPAKGGPAGPCRQIAAIELKNAFALSAKDQDGLVGAYRGKCLSAGDIQALLADITKAYIDRGYATTRVYVPAQDLSTGRLQLLIVEGRIGAISLKDKARRTVNLATAFPGLTGKALNLRDLEQGLDQINRLASNNATMDLRPGKTAGDSEVVITNRDARRLHAELAADNQGANSTGRNQGAVTVSADNLAGLNDFVSVTHRQSRPFNGSGADQGRSTSDSLFVSVPWGYTTFSTGGSTSTYKSFVPAASGAILKLKGDSTSLYGGVRQILHRGRTDQLTLAGVVTAKDSDNFLNGQKIGVSSRRLSVLTVDLDYNRPVLGGAFDIDLGYSQGLTAFGALKDVGGLLQSQPRAQYKAARLTASWFRPFKLGRQAFSFDTQLSAQQSQDTLYGSEQFSIGGVGSVRGFHEATLTADNGAYLRTELGMPIVLRGTGGPPATLKPYVGLDAGRVTSHASGGPEGSLTGATVGTSLSWRRIFVDLFASHRLGAPAGLKKEGTVAFARLSARF